MTLVILDQFTGPTPYALNRDPVSWATFMAAVRSGTFASSWRRAVIVDAPEGYILPTGTTAYAEQDGRVVVWQTCWDTSG